MLDKKVNTRVLQVCDVTGIETFLMTAQIVRLVM